MVRDMRTPDAYEASYYLASGMKLRKMEVCKDLPEGGQCVFVLSGEEHLIDSLCAQYMTGHAMVNVSDWRRAYVQVCHQMRLAKKNPSGGAK